MKLNCGNYVSCFTTKLSMKQGKISLHHQNDRHPLYNKFLQLVPV